MLLTIGARQAVNCVRNLFKQGVPAVQAASKLVMMAYEAGSMDNISAVVVYFDRHTTEE